MLLTICSLHSDTLCYGHFLPFKGDTDNIRHLGEVVVHALGELLHARGSLLGQLLSELCESCDVTDEHSAIKGLHARFHTPGR